MSTSTTLSLIRQINGFLNQPNFQNTQKDRIVEVGQSCINLLNHAEDGKESTHQNDNEVPICTVELKSILASISIVEFDRSNELVELILLTLAKLLLRASENRVSLGKSGVEMLVKIMHQRMRIRKSSSVIAEICGMILNACYDKENVSHICETNNGVLMLLNCIHHRDDQIIAASLGALQAVCFAPMGRRTLRLNFEILNKLVAHLTHEFPVIRARALGTIHNLSVDSVAIVPLMNSGCIPLLVQIIRDPNEEICALALGTLQNLTREPNAKILACEAGALPIVAGLLMSSSVPCQVTALGTFMNLAESPPGQDSSSLHSLLAEAIALGAINSCVFEGANIPG